MKTLLLFLLLSLSSCASAPPSGSPISNPEPPATQPAPGKPSNLEATCPAPGIYQAADYVGAADQRFYDAMRYIGVKTIIRYFDWEKESLKGKIPTAQELADIKRNGFEFMAIFQHLNNQLASFTAARGAYDAKRSLELASRWGQPRGSAIYFGVDGDFWTADEKQKVRNYFAAAAPIIRGAGLRVGMYGSGANCESLKAAGLIDGELCWIAASSHGWSGTKDILAKGKGYALAQRVKQSCGGKTSLDLNKVLISDFGQWRLP